jgi:NADP-dependent 3-hydroxy acid dehydrogenase YdfG
MHSSGNLGGAAVWAFHAAGAKLVLSDRHADRIQTLFPKLADEGGHYLAASTVSWLLGSSVRILRSLMANIP